MVTGRFWTGFLTGVFATVFFITLIGYYVIKVNGIAVAVDQNLMARTVREKVQAEVAKEIPALLSEVKLRVPKAITNNMTNFDHVSIQIGSEQFPLPADASRVFKEQFQGIAEEAVIQTINTFEVEPYIQQIGQASYKFVQETLHDEVLGKTFSFQANRWLHLPVIVQGK